MDWCEQHERAEFSPLKLLYTAYSDQLPMDSQILRETYPPFHRILKELSQQEQRELLQSLYSVFSDSQRHAFEAGVRTGFRLASEICHAP